MRSVVNRTKNAPKAFAEYYIWAYEFPLPQLGVRLGGLGRLCNEHHIPQPGSWR